MITPTPSPQACAEFQRAWLAIDKEESNKAANKAYNLSVLSDVLRNSENGVVVDPDRIDGLGRRITHALEETIDIRPQAKRDRLMKAIFGLGIQPDVELGNTQSFPLMRRVIQNNVVSVIPMLYEAGFRLPMGREKIAQHSDRHSMACCIGMGSWPKPELIDPGMSKDPDAAGGLLEGVIWFLEQKPEEKEISNVIRKLDRFQRYMKGQDMGPILTQELESFISGGMWRNILARSPPHNEPLLAKLMTIGMNVGPALKAIEQAPELEKIAALFARSEELNLRSRTPHAATRHRSGMRL